MSTSLHYTYTPPHPLSTLDKIPSLHFNNSVNFFSTSQLSLPLLHLGCSRHGRLHETRIRRGIVVTRAGPSTSQFVFAFAFPLSLLLVTVFTAFIIGIQLEQKFLEEVAINEAIREEQEEEDELAEVPTPRKEEPALPQSRNRPKREV